MDVNDLKHDEFLVECEVRLLTGSHVNRFKDLVEALTGENEHPVLAPVRAHAAALKQPKREITLCANKVQSLKRDLFDKVSNITDAELKSIRSRLIHVINRLLRIASSPTYGDQVKSWLEAGKKLLEMVNNFDRESTSLDESIEIINNMEQMKLSIEPIDPFDNVTESVETTPGEKLTALLNSPHSGDFLKIVDEFHRIATTPISSTKTSRIEPKPPTQTIKDTVSLEPTQTNPIIQNPRKIHYEKSLVSVPSRFQFTGPLASTSADTQVPIYHASNLHQMGLQETARADYIDTNQLLKIMASRFPHLGNLDYLLNVERSPSIPLDNFNPQIPPPNIQNIGLSIPTSKPHSQKDFTFTNERDINSNFGLTRNAQLHPRENHREYSPQPYRKPEHWNLVFEGSRNDVTTIDRFLNRVETMAVRYNISENKLVDELSVLLKGDALEWYWTFVERNRHVTWLAIKSELINRFQCRKSDDDIIRDLHNRKQNYPREKFYDFYSTILKLSMQLRVPFSETEMLRCLKLNMRPGLHLEIGHELQYIRSVNELIQRCVELEDLWSKYGWIPETNLTLHKSVQEVVIDSGDASVSGFSDSAEVCSLNQSIGYKPPVPKYADVSNKNQKPSTSATPQVTCFNCAQRGHYANTCPHPKKSMELEGFNFVCPKCNYTGNVSREGRPVALSSLQTHQISELLPQKSEMNPYHLSSPNHSYCPQ